MWLVKLCSVDAHDSAFVTSLMICRPEAWHSVFFLSFFPQACLGWEPEVVDFQVGLTLPSDMWLQVLQSVSHAFRLILAYFGATGIIRVRKEGGTKNLNDSTSVAMLKTIAAEGAEVQKMLRRVSDPKNVRNTGAGGPRADCV